MSFAVLPLETLAPFVAVTGLMLGISALTSIIEGYEAPASASDSITRIVRLTGGVAVGLLGGHVIFYGIGSWDRVGASLAGILVAIFTLFLTDMLVLRLKANKKRNHDGEAR